MAVLERNRTLPPAIAGPGRIDLMVLTCGAYGSMLRLPPPPSMNDRLLTEGPEILTTALREHQ